LGNIPVMQYVTEAVDGLALHEESAREDRKVEGRIILSEGGRERTNGLKWLCQLDDHSY